MAEDGRAVPLAATEGGLARASGVSSAPRTSAGAEVHSAVFGTTMGSTEGSRAGGGRPSMVDVIQTASAAAAMHSQEDLGDSHAPHLPLTQQRSQRRSSIFREEVVENLPARHQLYLQSFEGVMLQGTICVVYTGLSAYDPVIKKMAVATTGDGGKHKKFEMISLIVWTAVLSICFGVGLAWKCKQLHHLMGQKALRMLGITAPIGCIFAFTSYLQLVCLQYMPADVFGIFDQARLLVMASVAYMVLNRKQSQMAWILLSLICIVSTAYAFVRMGEEAKEKNDAINHITAVLLNDDRYMADVKQGLRGVLLPPEVLGCDRTKWADCKNFHFGPEEVNIEMLVQVLQNTSTTALEHLSMKEHLIHDLAPHVSGKQADVHASLAKGIPLTLFFQLLQSCAATYQEKVLQGYGEIPIYVQKVYQEFWAFWFSLLNAALIAPFMSSLGYGRATPPEASLLRNPFYGWDNPWVFACFFMLITRSWLTVIIMKMLSAIVKQLCAVVAMCLVYMIAAGYTCKDGKTFCPISGLSNLSWRVTFVDLGVLLAVASYVLLKREEKLTAEALQAAQAANSAK